MNVQIEESWKTHLQPEFEKDYFRTLTEFVKSEYSQYQIFPPGKLIFNAFNLCPFDKVKVVIIGQDPLKAFQPQRCDRQTLRPLHRQITRLYYINTGLYKTLYCVFYVFITELPVIYVSAVTQSTIKYPYSFHTHL